MSFGENPCLQEVCNGRGVCECAECICDANSPYFGDFCELCSGDEVCRLQTCAADGDNALCASCVIDRLEQLRNGGVDIELFTPEGLEEAIMANGTLPEGSNLTMATYGEGLKTAAIQLPEKFSTECSSSVSASCPRFYVVNETQEMEYEIQGEWVGVFGLSSRLYHNSA